MNKTALITGGTGGIGSALCTALAKSGYDIVVHCFKNEEKAKKLCKELESNYGISATFIKADLKIRSEIKRLSEKALSFGNLQVLINNAGIAYTELFQYVPDEKADEIFSLNTQGAIYLTKEILPHMIKEHNGRIINISSMWGVSGGSCEVHYSASKAALIGFTKALAKEVGPSGITVNCIAPGLIDTEMNSHLSAEDIQAIVDETPVSRIGKPEDVAALAAFLSGDDASFITGQVISVDGGFN